MVNPKSKLCITLILALFAVCLSGCSLENLDFDLNQIIEGIMSELSSFWNDLGQILPDFGSILEGILSGLSGIGDAIRDMFADFKIF